MIKVVLLDIDDTLLSFEGYVKTAMISGFDKFAIGPFKEEMLAVFHRVNSELWHRLEQGDLSFEKLKEIRWNRVFEALGIDADGVKFEAYFRDCLFDSAIPVEGALSLLEYLKKKYVLCAASNGPYLQQKHRLEIGGMLPFFSHLFISEEIGHSKPSKEFFSVCMARLNQSLPTPVSSREVAIIGDSLRSDVAGGIHAGMTTIYYNPKKEALPSSTKPDYTIHSLKEIETIL